MHKLKVSPPAAYILRGGLMVSNALLISSIAFLYAALPYNGASHQFFSLSQSLRETCSAVLFFTIFGSAFAEQSVSKAKK